MVAACLKYRATVGQGDSRQGDASLAWLNQFMKTDQAGDDAIRAGGEFLVYLLMPADVSHELSVRFHVTRRLKNGQIGKGRQTDMHNLAESYLSPAYASEIDRQIGRLIKLQDTPFWNNRDYTLKGETGFLALSKMLQSGRCFWQDTRRPALQAGAPRTLQLDWQEAGRGSRRLRLKLDIPALLLNTLPVLYLDQEAGTLGPVEGADFNEKQWEMLLAAPLVPADVLPDFSQQLLLKGTHCPLPPPLEIETLEIRDQPPLHLLYLYSERDSELPFPEHRIRLRYAYDGHETRVLPDDAVHKQLSGNRLITVHRDKAAEKDTQQRLFDAGFHAYLDEQQGDMIFGHDEQTDQLGVVSCWQHFLEEILPDLQAEGWQVEHDADFQMQFVAIDNWDVDIEADNDWFDLRFDLDIEGRKLPLLPFITELLTSYEPNSLQEPSTCHWETASI